MTSPFSVVTTSHFTSSFHLAILRPPLCMHVEVAEKTKYLLTVPVPIAISGNQLCFKTQMIACNPHHLSFPTCDHSDFCASVRTMKEHLALTNLRDNKAFPTFMECPQEKDVPYRNSDFYEPEEGLCFPISHRCFLGEVTESVLLSQPGLKVKDRTGQVVTIRFDFYSNDSGRALARFAPEMLHSLVQRTVPMSLTKTGNTIAILYAMRHDFEDGSGGFRIEHAHQVQVGPIPLEENLLKRPTHSAFRWHSGTIPRSW